VLLIYSDKCLVGDRGNTQIYTKLKRCYCTVHAIVLSMSIVLNYFAFQPFNFQRTWCRLILGRVVRTKLDIHYVGTYLWREDGCDPIKRFNSPHLCACLKPGIVFPTWSLCIHWNNKRGDCLWYLWNWWPSLYNFHNNTSTYRPSASICVNVSVDINDIGIIWIYSIDATGTPNWNIAAISRIYCSEQL